MRHLKVGAKILLGFGIVIALMIVTFVIVVSSSSITIENSEHIDHTTTLQMMSAETMTLFLEARVHADTLYNIVSEDAYNDYSSLAGQIEAKFTDMFTLIDENPRLETFRAAIKEDSDEFIKWHASIDSIRALHLEKSSTLATYNETEEVLKTVASEAYTSQADTFTQEIYLNPTTDILINRSKFMGTASEIQGYILDIRVDGAKLALSYDQDSYSLLMTKIDTLRKRTEYFLQQNTDSLLTSSALARVLRNVDEFQAIAAQYGEVCERTNAAVNAAMPLDIALRTSLENSQKEMDASVNSAVDVTLENASSALLVVIAISAVSIIFAVAIALYISRSITKPLKFLSSYIGNVADTGDLGLVDINREICAYHSSHRDEVGETVDAANRLFDMMEHQGALLKQIAEKDVSQVIKPRSANSTVELIAADLLAELNNVLAHIQDSSTQVSNGSRQIADGAQALAYGSADQATAIENLGKSIAHVSEQTKHSADMAVRAAELGEVIRQNAEKGSTQMANMVQAVEEINQASASIGKVIKIIDDIAFQTNILALNASVEAARAGQHGKGFAVVAGEVRNLASKSAAAAKDTGALIANTMEKAQLGAKIALETSASLDEIVSGIVESGKIVDDIAQSSERQDSELERINSGVTQVAKVVHQNSATAEQSAAAAEEMSAESEALAQLASQFKLRDAKMLGGGMSHPALRG